MAKQSGKREVNFRVKILNQWTDSPEVWIPDDRWMEANKGEVSAEELKKYPCYAGLDLAPRHDLTALVLMWQLPEGWVCKAWFWATENQVRRYEDIVDYHEWKQKGFLEVHPGDEMDFKIIADKIKSLFDEYKIKGLAYDPYKFFTVKERLLQLGLSENMMTSYQQGTRQMGPVLIEIEQLILSGKLNHQGNPVLRWMASNVELWYDSDGNFKFKKSAEQNKIDGLVALAMAFGMFRISADAKQIPDDYNLRIVNTEGFF